MNKISLSKVYQLPAYVLPTKYTMFFTQHGHLVVEFPIMETTESVYPRCNTTTQYNGADAYTHAESVDVTVGMVVKGSIDQSHQSIIYLVPLLLHDSLNNQSMVCAKITGNNNNNSHQKLDTRNLVDFK